MTKKQREPAAKWLEPIAVSIVLGILVAVAVYVVVYAAVYAAGLVL